MNSEAEYRLECPVFATIKKGQRYFARVKIGGESQLINVMTYSDPYKADFGKGRKAFYVDVFSYDYKDRILASKLRVAVVKGKQEVTC